MSERSASSSSSSSHATAWTLAVVVLLLPVLYMLSVPPLFRICLETGVWRFDDPPPTWVMNYAAPYAYVVKETPLQGPLQVYMEWIFKGYAP